MDQNRVRAIVQQSLERLISHVDPTEHDDIPSTLDGYQRLEISAVQNLLQSRNVSRFEISTLLQPFAGPPGTPNRVILLTGLNGQKYFTIGRYDPVRNEILPPT